MRSSRSPGPDGARDGGAATVEFVLVGTLVVLMGLALVQLVLALHVRNTLTSSAYEGARHAAQADRSLADGEHRAVAIAADALGGIDATAVARHSSAAGGDVVVVTMTAPLPLLGVWGPGTLSVEARAFDEVAGG